MKLFVWVDPYDLMYGSSLLFAVAETEADAKIVAAQSIGYKYGKYPQDGSFSAIAEKLGPADRVLDIPCSEWHEWTE